MQFQQMLGRVRKAVEDYHMIEEGDLIAVGVSGGKDSVTLLLSLDALRRFYPKHFQILAVTVDLGYEAFDPAPIRRLCEEYAIPYQVVKTQISEIVFCEHPQENPCSLCARLRKGALNQAALEYGCNKIAYAHHKDDVVETLLLSLFYEGRFHTFSPVTRLDRTGLTLIRPLIYLKEAEVVGFIRKYHLPVVHNPCPAEGNTKREYVKDLLKRLNQENPGIKERMFTAVLNAGIDGWGERNATDA